MVTTVMIGFNHGYGGYDPDGNYHWHGGYTKDEFDNWEGPWYGGWVYGLGYVYPDVNIYGYQGGTGSGYYGFVTMDTGMLIMDTGIMEALMMVIKEVTSLNRTGLVCLTA